VLVTDPLWISFVEGGTDRTGRGGEGEIRAPNSSTEQNDKISEVIEQRQARKRQETCDLMSACPLACLRTSIHST